MKTVLAFAAALFVASSVLAFDDFNITVYNPVTNRDDSVPVRLHTPAMQHPARPAVLWFSGCDGELHPGGQVDLIKRLNAVGVLVAEVRSLDTWARGGSVCMNPRRVPEALRTTEAFIVRAELVKRGYAAGDNIGITGASHGARVANMAALHDSPEAPTEQAFAAAVATYPACVNDARSFHLRTPLLILTAERDELTPRSTCENFLGQISRNEERTGLKNAEVVMKVFPGATHAWDANYPTRSIAFFNGVHLLEYNHQVTTEAVNLSFEFLRKYMKF